MGVHSPLNLVVVRVGIPVRKLLGPRPVVYQGEGDRIIAEQINRTGRGLIKATGKL